MQQLLDRLRLLDPEAWRVLDMLWTIRAAGYGKLLITLQGGRVVLIDITTQYKLS